MRTPAVLGECYTMKFIHLSFQCGFIGFICKPLYTTLAKLLPNTEPLLTGCLTSKENWEKTVAEIAAAEKADS